MITGERLSKSQRQAVTDAKESRLTAEQRQHLANLRDRLTNAESNQEEAEQSYNRAVKIMSLAGATDQARALRESNARLARAQLDIRTAELGFGLTSSGDRPPTAQVNNGGQGGPMPRPPSAMQKAAQTEAFDRLTPEQREMHRNAAQEVKAAKRGHLATREELLERIEGGNPTQIAAARQNHEYAEKVHHDAQVRLATLRKNFGLD